MTFSQICKVEHFILYNDDELLNIRWGAWEGGVFPSPPFPSLIEQSVCKDLQEKTNLVLK